MKTKPTPPNSVYVRDGIRMWLARPIWMLRYYVSSWMMTAAMAVMPSPRYRAELRRRVHGYRDEVIAEVLAQRILDGKQG